MPYQDTPMERRGRLRVNRRGAPSYQNGPGNFTLELSRVLLLCFPRQQQHRSRHRSVVTPEDGHNPYPMR